MGSFKIGWIMAAWLLALTITDYAISHWVDQSQLRFSLLAIGAFLEAVPIAYYFMHISRLWRGEAH